MLGDPLDVIASGPTVPDSSTPQAALDVLEQFHARAGRHFRRPCSSTCGSAAAQTGELRDSQLANAGEVEGSRSRRLPAVDTRVTNLVIGNNATAVECRRRGSRATRLCGCRRRAQRRSEGPAEDVGHRAGRHGRAQCGPDAGPACLISGGEPVVRLVDASRRGLGGRNQQLVLAALTRLADDGGRRASLCSPAAPTARTVRPTPPAPCWMPTCLAACRQRSLDPADYLARNDAYHFFEPLGALISTGPTHTNVCDLRVVVVDREEQFARGKVADGVAYQSIRRRLG